MADILAENSQRDDAEKASRRQAVILSRWEEIRDAYSHGWSYREIWKGLEREGVVDCGYSTFMHYISKIRYRLLEAEKGIVPPAVRKKTDEKQNATVKPPPAAPGSTRVEIPGFGQNLPPRDPKKF